MKPPEKGAGMNEGMWVPRRITRRDFLGLTVAGIGVSMLGGCGSGGGGSSEGYRITLIQGVRGDEFYISMECGAQAKAQELGVELDVQGPPEFSAAEQTPILNAAVQASPDAILIAPTDKVAMIGPIQGAINQDIAVFTVDTFIEEDIALANISSDNLEGGRKAAQALAGAIGEEGKVFCISVKPGISTTDQRQQGFEQGLKEYPDIEYLGTEFCEDDPNRAAQIANATIQSNPDLAGIFGANIFSVQGAATGVRQAGEQGNIKIVGFDAGPTQIKDLREEAVDALVAQHPSDIGSIAVQMAADYLDSNEKPSKKEVKTGLSIVTRDNYEKPDISKYLYKAEC
jgi:ribose transport system substrate-binding protein